MKISHVTVRLYPEDVIQRSKTSYEIHTKVLDDIQFMLGITFVDATYLYIDGDCCCHDCIGLKQPDDTFIITFKPCACMRSLSRRKHRGKPIASRQHFSTSRRTSSISARPSAGSAHQAVIPRARA